MRAFCFKGITCRNTPFFVARSCFQFPSSGFQASRLPAPTTQSNHYFVNAWQVTFGTGGAAHVRLRLLSHEEPCSNITHPQTGFLRPRGRLNLGLSSVLFECCCQTKTGLFGHGVRWTTLVALCAELAIERDRLDQLSINHSGRGTTSHPLIFRDLIKASPWFCI